MRRCSPWPAASAASTTASLPTSPRSPARCTPREPAAAARGLTVHASITAAPTHGDARLLERLAANLIDNAIRHNIPQGQIDIQVTASGGQPRLKITNTGPVIAASETTRLLHPFQRRPGSRPASSDGLGMGLSIVAAITKAHDGSLAINPGPQGGLDIDISLPATAAITPATHSALATT